MKIIASLKSFFGGSLYRRMVLPPILVLLFFLVMESLYTSYQGNKQLTEFIEQRDLILAEKIGRDIDFHLRNLVNILRLQGRILLESTDAEVRSEALVALRRQFPYTFGALYVLNDSGQVVAFVSGELESVLKDGALTYDPPLEQTFSPQVKTSIHKAVSLKRVELSPAEMTGWSTIPEFYLTVPLVGAEGKVRSYISAVVDVRTLWSLLSGLDEHQGTISLLDSTGLILAGTNKRHIGTIRDDVITADPELGHKGILQTQETDSAAYSSIGIFTDWLVLVEKNPKSMPLSIGKLLPGSAIISSIGALLALFIMVLMVRRIIRPIESTARTAEIIGRDARIDDDLVEKLPQSSAKELNDLIGSFTGMVLSLKGALSRLESTNTRLADEIEKRAELQNRMIKAKEEAEAANHAKTKHLADMSHELRTPLAGMLGMLKLLNRSELNTEQQDYLESALTAGESLLTMVNDILESARARKAVAHIEESEFNLYSAVHSVMESLSFQARDKGLVLEYDVDPTIPIPLLGDAGRLRQILFNLAGNGLKYTNEGLVRLTASLQAETEDAVTLLFKISDTGIGIPKEELQHVFQPYYRVDSKESRRPEGAGLGLDIVKRLVESMHGDISIQSNPGQGTTVSFHITVKKSKQARLPDPSTTHTAGKLSGLSVLIVEDDPINRITFESYIKTSGHKPHAASDGKEGLTALQNGSYDIVVLDLVLPDMDGRDFVNTVRNDPEFSHISGIPVVTVTGRGLKPDNALQFEQTQGHLEKPVSPDDLERAVLRASTRYYANGRSTLPED